MKKERHQSVYLLTKQYLDIWIGNTFENVACSSKQWEGLIRPQNFWKTVWRTYVVCDCLKTGKQMKQLTTTMYRNFGGFQDSCYGGRRLSLIVNLSHLFIFWWWTFFLSSFWYIMIHTVGTYQPYWVLKVLFHTLSDSRDMLGIIDFPIPLNLITWLIAFKLSFHNIWFCYIKRKSLSTFSR